MNLSILAQIPVSMQVQQRKNSIVCPKCHANSPIRPQTEVVSILEFSVWLSATVLALVTFFQIALILGAPWGEYAFGGKNKRALPRNLRIGSVVTSLIYIGIIGAYLAQIGIFPQLLSPDLNQKANWSIVGLSALALIMNTITPSKKECMSWAPVSLVLLASSV
jgi:hypothetical protein